VFFRLLRSPKRKLREAAFFRFRSRIPLTRVSGFPEFGSAQRTIRRHQLPFERVIAALPDSHQTDGTVESDLQPVRKASAEVGQRIAKKLQQATGQAGRGGPFTGRQLDAGGSGIIHTMNRTGVGRDHQRGIQIDHIVVVIDWAAIFICSVGDGRMVFRPVAVEVLVPAGICCTR